MTAVEWLIEQMNKNTWYDESNYPQVNIGVIDLEQAKEMEKQQSYSEEEVKKIMALTWLKCSDNNAENFLENRNKILKQFK